MCISIGNFTWPEPNSLCWFASCSTFPLKVLTKPLPSLPLKCHLGLSLSLPSLPNKLLKQILPLLCHWHQNCVFFSCAIIYKSLPVLLDLINTNIHASLAFKDAGVCLPCCWKVSFWKGWGLQCSSVWAWEAVPSGFLGAALLIARACLADGSVSRVTLGGLADSFKCAPALLCREGPHISRAFPTLALQAENSTEEPGQLCLGLSRPPSPEICSKRLIALDPFRRRLCRHVFLQRTTRAGGTLPEEPAAFGIRWLERSPLSVFETKSLLNICCKEFSWLMAPREAILFLFFSVSLIIKVIFLPSPHPLCLCMCFFLGAG